MKENRSVQRVCIVGNSGSGKTHLARRLAVALGVPHVELDALNHRVGGTALACAVLLLTAACGEASTRDAGQPPARTGGPSCEERSLDSPPDGSIDWANYLRWKDRVYTARLEKVDVAVGQPLGTVTCKRSSSRTPVDHIIGDGEAAFLEPGTPFHAIQGRSPEQAITAQFNGQQLVFTLDAQLTAQLADAQRPASDVLRISPDGTTGATVCMAETAVDLPDKHCRRVSKEAADRLAAALDGAEPYGRGTTCLGDGAVYKILFDNPSAQTIAIIVPTACGPINDGEKRYRINDRVVRAVTAEHDAAGRGG